MAPTTPTGVPASLAAGDSWLWQQSYGDFPVSEGWTLSYRFRGASTFDTKAAEVVASSETWTVTIAPGRTASLTPGNYQWIAVMTGSGTYAGRVHTAESGVLEVTRNLATAQDGEAQSWEETALTAIEAVLSNQITDAVASYMIGGRQVVTIPLGELRALRASLKRAVARQAGKSAFTEHRVAFRGVA